MLEALKQTSEAKRRLEAETNRLAAIQKRKRMLKH
jgi:hypothetical protein